MLLESPVPDPAGSCSKGVSRHRARRFLHSRRGATSNDHRLDPAGSSVNRLWSAAMILARDRHPLRDSDVLVIKRNRRSWSRNVRFRRLLEFRQSLHRRVRQPSAWRARQLLAPSCPDLDVDAEKYRRWTSPSERVQSMLVPMNAKARRPAATSFNDVREPAHDRRPMP